MELGTVNSEYSTDNEEVSKSYNQNEVEKGEANVSPPEESEKSKSSTTVKRSVGLMSAISIIVGTMIGSGIFASTSAVFNHTNSLGLSLVVWAGSGLISMMAALCYAELGTMIPKSGGEFTYLKEAYGELPAFLFSFTTTVILKPAQLTAIALATGDYITEPIAVLRCNPDERKVVTKLITAFILGTVVFVNSVSVRVGVRVQVFFTAAKLSALAMLIITGLVKIGQGHTENLKEPFKGSSTAISDIGFAFYGGLWAYDGWNNLNFLTDELKNPFRTLPLSIMIGIPTVTGFYIMANIAYSVVLTPTEIGTSKAVAVLMANRSYGVMAWIMPLLVACSTYGAANGTAFGVGRLIYVSAKNGHMPALLSMVHTKKHTPIPALVFTCAIGCLMIAPDSSNFVTLINYFNFAAWTFYGLTISTVIWLRIRRPDAKRPYKVFIGVPIIVLLCAIYLVVAPFVANPLPSLYCFLFILFGIPLYFAFVKYQIMPKPVLNGFYKFTKKVQMTLNLSMPQAENVE